jgi:hypothetical protein
MNHVTTQTWSNFFFRVSTRQYIRRQRILVHLAEEFEEFIKRQKDEGMKNDPKLQKESLTLSLKQKRILHSNKEKTNNTLERNFQKQTQNSIHSSLYYERRTDKMKKELVCTRQSERVFRLLSPPLQ